MHITNRSDIGTASWSLVWLLLLMAGCTDIYQPDIESVSNLLVVEGLITDQPGPHLVKLTRSAAYGQPFPRVMESGAIVFIENDGGVRTILEEKRAGHYYTPQSFRGRVGDTYVLHIESTGGKQYRSMGQILMPPLRVDHVSAELGYRPFFLSSRSSGSISEMKVMGGKVFFTFSGQESPRFRFNTWLLVDYFIVYPGVFPTMDYCWIKRQVNDYLDNDIGQGFGTGITGRHQVGFIPAIPHTLPFMGFPNYTTGPEDTFYGSTRVIMNYLFALNDDAFQFHYMRNKQLDSEGRFFDPIAAQLPGNVSNVDDPHEPVLGLFEASSVSFTPVRVRVTPFDISAEMIQLSDTIPDTGCLYEEVPGFFREMF